MFDTITIIMFILTGIWLVLVVISLLQSHGKDDDDFPYEDEDENLDYCEEQDDIVNVPGYHNRNGKIMEVSDGKVIAIVTETTLPN